MLAVFLFEEMGLKKLEKAFKVRQLASSETVVSHAPACLCISRTQRGTAVLQKEVHLTW